MMMKTAACRSCIKRAPLLLFFGDIVPVIITISWLLKLISALLVPYKMDATTLIEMCRSLFFVWLRDPLYNHRFVCGGDHKSHDDYSGASFGVH